jgi:endo-1,4-beta-xylanase
MANYGAKAIVIVLFLAISASITPTLGKTDLDICLSKNELNYEDCLGQSFRSATEIPIGVAINVDLLVNEKYNQIITHHFSSVTPENVMKMGLLVGTEDLYSWISADTLVDFAEDINASIHGHVLVWHNQLPEWINQYSGSADDWNELLKNHIQTVVGHYAGRIKNWDVLNEAVLDDGSGYRNTVWYDNIGSDYIGNAFKWAHEADPEAKLYYNDYSLSANSPKLDFVLDMINSLKADGVPIDGIGFQMHIQDDWPSLEQMQGAIEKVENLDLELRITELDVSINPQNIHKQFTAELAEKQKQRYYDVVNLFLQSPKLTGITLWGLSDADSWIPYFFNRNDWPLLFDTNREVKPAAEGFLQALKFQPYAKGLCEYIDYSTISSQAETSESDGFSNWLALISIIVIIPLRRLSRKMI